MISTLARNWWAVTLRGGIAVLFGLTAIAWPVPGLQSLLLLFAGFLIIDGAFAAAAGLARPALEERWWALLGEGLAGAAVGLLVFLWTGLPPLLLVYLIALWSIVTGLLEVAAAVRLRAGGADEVPLALAGFASMTLGTAIVLVPDAGAEALAWLLGAYAIVFGALMIALGLRLRRLSDGGTAHHASPRTV
jgi:uncharacterized membrane protein HdeD (DUF308 family)